jgi:hypothetical protein
MKFPLQPVPYSFVREAPWIFRSELCLTLGVDECYKIILDDTAWSKWHPEVTNIVWKDSTRGVGAERSVDFKDWVFMLLLAGPTRIEEHFDVWEDSSDDRKRVSFYFASLNRPNFLTYSAAREELIIEKTEEGCKFTRIVALRPSFATRYLLGWLAHRRFSYVLERKCPQRFVDAFDKKKSTTQEQRQQQQQQQRQT